jgi:DNA-binding transcriptional regulator YiaG
MEIGRGIEKPRGKIDLSQAGFADLFGTTAMSISRYERGLHPVSSRALLALGLLARKAGMNGWSLWGLAGLTRADARSMLE